MLDKDGRPSPCKTRFISSRARGVFGMEHNVHVNTTVSTLELARARILGALREELDGWRPGDHSAARHLLQLWRRVHTVDMLNLSRIIGQIQTGANAYLKDFPSRVRNPSRTQASRFLVLHCKIDEPGQNVFRVYGHLDAAGLLSTQRKRHSHDR